MLAGVVCQVTAMLGRQAFTETLRGVYAIQVAKPLFLVRALYERTKSGVMRPAVCLVCCYFCLRNDHLVLWSMCLVRNM